MKIQVDSDKTIAVDASLIGLIEGEVRRLLGRFAIRLTAWRSISATSTSKRGESDSAVWSRCAPPGAAP